VRATIVFLAAISTDTAGAAGHLDARQT